VEKEKESFSHMSKEEYGYLLTPWYLETERFNTKTKASYQAPLLVFEYILPHHDTASLSSLFYYYCPVSALVFQVNFCERYFV
jgi:hypothetical protein